MSGQSISYGNGTSFANILAQIDQKCLITGSSSPIGSLAVAGPGVFFYDTAHGTLYFCTATDGTILGTVWEPVPFVLPTASTTQAGIVQLATETDATNGTDDTKALTPLAGSIYAKSGANSDITALNGLTQALSRAVGGTGITGSIPEGQLLAGLANGNWGTTACFGAGEDGGQFLNGTGGIITLGFNSPTRFIVSGTWNVILPAYTGTVNDGFLFRIKMIGTSQLTFTVSDGSNVDGVLSYVINTSAIQGNHYPSIDFQLINEAWWEV